MTARHMQASINLIEGIEDGFEIAVECENERTSIVVVNGGELFPMPVQPLITNALVQSVAIEHLTSCEPCAAHMRSIQKSDIAKANKARR